MEFISNIIGEFAKSFNDYAKNYPIIAGALSLWGLGVISYICRDIPRRIYNFFRRIFTTTITITSSSDGFYIFLKWYHLKGFADKGRYLKISNGRFGSDDMIKSVGYGNHIFWYKKRPLLLSMEQKEGIGRDKELDQITIVKLGRSHDIFNQLFKDICHQGADKEKYVIKKFSIDYWETSSEQRKRSFDSIFLKEGIKDRIVKHLENFQSKESWYLDNGIPYQTGILLYGPPGTGKTSVIKAISSYIDYQIHILRASSLANIENAMFNLPEKSLIVIEDIDNCGATNKRKKKNYDMSAPQPVQESGKPTPTKNNETDADTAIFDITFANLGDILNSIDGIHTVHGRIIIATTNYVDDLDDALIRDGRFDLKIEIGYVDSYVLKNIFKRFYPNFLFPIECNIKDEITMAYIQNLILENINNPNNVLKELMI